MSQTVETSPSPEQYHIVAIPLVWCQQNALRSSILHARMCDRLIGWEKGYK